MQKAGHYVDRHTLSLARDSVSLLPMRIYSLLALSIISVLASATASSAPNMEVERYSKSNQYFTAGISPDGNQIAALGSNEGKKILAIINTKTLAPLSLIGFKAARQPGEFVWINNERLIYLIEEPIAWFQPPESAGEWVAVNVDGSRDKNIYGYRAGERQTGSRIKKIESYRAHGYLVDRLESSDKKIIMAAVPFENEGGDAPELLELEIYLGTTKRITFSPVRRPIFKTDLNERLRMVTGRSSPKELSTYYWDLEGSDQKRIATGSLAGGYLQAVSFIHDDEVYVTDSRNTETQSLGLLNVESGDIRVFYEHDQVDPSNFLHDEETNTLYAVEYESAKPEYFFVNESNKSARVLKALQRSFPSHHVIIVSHNADSRQSVVQVYSDQDPGAFYLYDRETKEAKHSFDTRPWIDPKRSAARESFTIEAHDGLLMMVHLTLPADALGPPPLIVYPHDGPLGQRSTWQYNPLIQMLANQGYVVLQIDYRGSKGFGKKHEFLGTETWGSDIPRDIVTAAEHVVEQQLTTNDVCIYGEGFAAYTALRSTVIAPKLFSCAIAVGRIYDPVELYQHAFLPWHYDDTNFYREMTKDSARMRAFDVIDTTIPVPVMFAYGDATLNAPTQQADAMRKCLKKNKSNLI